MLTKNREILMPVMGDPGRYRLQIAFTQVNRDEKNRPSFKHFAYRLDTTAFFYTASMVKLPLAAIALEKLFLLGRGELNRNTRLEYEANYPCQSPVSTDPSSETGYPTLSNYIRKLFVVSDNDAYNRLYEFVGQKHLNERLWNMGYSSARINTRFAGCDADQNRHTNAVKFISPEGKLLYRQEPQNYTDKIKNPYGKQIVGTGRYNDSGQFFEGGWDFTDGNFMSLWDLHRILISIIFPQAVNPDHRFILMDRDFDFLKSCMSAMPRECPAPNYNPEEYFDCYVKYLLYGREKDPVNNPDIRIFNKVGMAFGFLTDCAYIVDYKNKVEFFLSVTVYVNEDETINDNKYDYNNIGLPFLKNLGTLFYQMELNRKKKYPPKLVRAEGLLGR